MAPLAEAPDHRSGEWFDRLLHDRRELGTQFDEPGLDPDRDAIGWNRAPQLRRGQHVTKIRLMG